MSQSATHGSIGGRRGREASRDPRTAAVGVVVSLLLHGMIVGAMMLATMWSESDLDKKVDDKMMEFEDVKLLQLGEEKPPGQLPEIANPAPKSAAEDSVALDQKDDQPKPDRKEQPKDPTPAEQPEPKAKPSKEKPAETDDPLNSAFDSLENDPNRPANNVVPEGSKKGVAEGNVSDEALASMMRTYQARLLQTLLKAWVIPTTISDDEMGALAGEVVVHVELTGQGHISSYRFLQKSSNRQFNGSIERVLGQFQTSGAGQTLPLPEEKPARQKVLQMGLDLKNWQHKTR